MTRRPGLDRRAAPASFALLLALPLALAAGPARAQTTTSSPPVLGQVTGLELALEGATSGLADGELRWLLTLYEVVGRDRLRPAAGGVVRVLCSDRPEAAVAVVRTDRHGRAAAAIPLRGQAPRSVRVTLEASHRGLRRTFEIDVSVEPAGRLEVVLDRASARPGERVTLVGRAVRGVARRPVAQAPLSLSWYDQDARTLAPPVDLVTSRTGAFVASVEVPAGIARLRGRVSGQGFQGPEFFLSVVEPPPPRMVVRAVPAARMVAPGAVVPVDLMVRRADGRPVRGATVETPGPTDPPTRTDAEGRARIFWPVPGPAAVGPVDDVTGPVVVRRAGLGVAETSFSVRIRRQPRAVGVAFEGGSFVPGLRSRLFVRSTLADGSPEVGVVVRVESPLLGDLEAVTDGSGVAVLEATPVSARGVEGRDRCGGATASAATITVGTTTVERCLPVDPDRTVALRPASPTAVAGGTVHVDLAARPAVARAPIELVLLRDGGAGLVPLARQVLPAGARRASVELPPDATGEILLRARPLVGPALDPVLGGSARLWVTPGPRTALTLEVREGAPWLGAPGAPGTVEGTLLVVPEAEAAASAGRVEQAMTPDFARLLDDPARAPDALLAGWLAARTGRDDAAPSVLRDGAVVVVPAPEDPTAAGVLRDPVRARARFVRGRLALVLRSLERRLEESIPAATGDVGLETPAGWRLNREALAAIVGAHLLEGERPATLGGEPLALEDLEALDPSITFDNLARRVTRQRLLRVLIALREFVRDRDLDLWLGRGDPNDWLRLLAGEEQEEGEDGDDYRSDFGSSDLTPSDLRDGWGRRMAIRRAPAGRTRFTRLAPLPPGWELVSAGPDGRFGTGDDLVDPFARVLRSGSPYAEAVAEDELLARLDRVEVGQATVRQILELFTDEGGLGGDGAPLEAAGGWDAMPSPLPPADEIGRFERAWRPVEMASRSLVELGPAGPVALGLGLEPRRYGLVALGFSPEGFVSVVRRPFAAGLPAVLTVEPPGVLHPGEPLAVAAVVARLPGGPDDLVLSVRARGLVRAELEGGGSEVPVELGPAGAVAVLLHLHPEGAGRGLVRVSLRSRSGGRGPAVELPLRVVAPGILREQAASAAVAGRTSLRVALPRDATGARSALVLSRPSGLLADPALEAWLERDPALVAWALAVSGAELPPHVIRRLEAATARDGSVAGEAPPLSGACAVVAWAASTEGTSWAPEATATHTSREVGAPGPEGPAPPLAAARLAALSLAVGPDDGSPLARAMAALRDSLRGAVRHQRDARATLARGAAALLLADPRDVRGRTMLALAREHVSPGFRGGLVVDLDEDDGDETLRGRRGAEQLAATAALAIAAHQAGERELATALARGAAARAHVATSLGGEPLFWYLAARAFGALGVADELEVEIVHGGASRRLSLGEQALVVPLDPPRPGREATVLVAPAGEGGALPLARLVTRYDRPARAVDGGPVRATLTGEPGYAGERAAYVLELMAAGDRTVDRPVALVALPSGASLDERARRAMEEARGVRDVAPPDPRGVVRVRLLPLAPSEPVRLPLPFVWSAAGRRAGTAIAAFPEDRSWQLSVTPPTEVEVGFRPELED